MPGKFIIKKGSTGKFRFSLVPTNGQIVATSEAYNSKASVMNGIRSMQKLPPVRHARPIAGVRGC